MKIIKQGSINKVAISRFAWKIMGMKAGWMPTVADKGLRNWKTIRMAQSGPSKTIDQVIDESPLDIWYGKSFVLRDSEEQIIDESVASQIVRDAFKYIVKKSPGSPIGQTLKAAAEGKIQNPRLSVSFSMESKKNYLVPTIGFDSYPDLSREFSGFVGQNHMIDKAPKNHAPTQGDFKIKGVTDANELIAMINAAGYLASNGIAEIGTIGARSTNWSTSYDMIFNGVPASLLQRSLSWFTDLTSQNINNLFPSKTQQSYSLTQFKEISQLMQSLGLYEEFSGAVGQIKAFEEEKGLKRIYERYGKIPNYRNRTKIITIKLADYLPKILNKIVQLCSQGAYKEMLEQSGVSDIPEAANLAFSAGATGDIFGRQEVQEFLALVAA